VFAGEDEYWPGISWSTSVVLQIGDNKSCSTEESIRDTELEGRMYFRPGGSVFDRFIVQQVNEELEGVGGAVDHDHIGAVSA
jgi:hypothetical protein